ncbi:GNAT family N-acetyltransferase [Pedobacter xixiisoli]|uniref:N-acetylglutamate synthase, GNAT family n=1 Tax=Pedobacter xixiisoli TaxID=1476464 RepID=A0A286A885_9SPHI|nr:GNAT family N-acetyltransferase [Pedobacter xixiisoli]SOD18102.1 N-acetylglutamate synthase, GNAT family [Pedobacter xixiisoli]
MEIIQLKSITETEALEIHSLSNQLGYANDFDSLLGRLKEIITLKDHTIFVAKADDKIVGWLHCLVCMRVESPLFVEVTGLVVDENVRGKQIGKKLIEASKSWSQDRDISIMRIRCNVLRTESHKFYKALGFSSSKEQKVFELSL